MFDKTTGAITGYEDLDEFNNHFSDFENAIVQGNSKKNTHRPFAKTLLMFMVPGVVTNFVFPCFVPCCIPSVPITLEGY